MNHTESFLKMYQLKFEKNSLVGFYLLVKWTIYSEFLSTQPKVQFCLTKIEK